MPTEPKIKLLLRIIQAMNAANPEFFREQVFGERELITLKVTTEFDNSSKVLELDICKGRSGNANNVSFRVKHPISNFCYESGWLDDLNEDMTLRVKSCFKSAMIKHIDSF